MYNIFQIGVGDLSFSQSRLDDCHGSEVSELECLVSDNNENNNVCEIYKSDYIHHPHPPDHLGDEDVLEGHRDRRKDDSGCATASLEILSASCHSPGTDLPSLNSLSLAREADGWPHDPHSLVKTIPAKHQEKLQTTATIQQRIKQHQDCDEDLQELPWQKCSYFFPKCWMLIPRVLSAPQYFLQMWLVIQWYRGFLD